MEARLPEFRECCFRGESARPCERRRKRGPKRTTTLHLMADAHDKPRSRRIIKLIAVERVIRGLLLLAGGIYLLAHLGADYGRLAESIMRKVELDPHQHFLHHIVTRLHALHAEQLRIAAPSRSPTAGSRSSKGVGLWLDQLWAEYLTVVVTTLLIPFEIYELVSHPTL